MIEKKTGKINKKTNQGEMFAVYTIKGYVCVCVCSVKMEKKRSKSIEKWKKYMNEQFPENMLKLNKRKANEDPTLIHSLSDREKETWDFGSSLSRQSRGKQHSDVSVGVPYGAPVR